VVTQLLVDDPALELEALARTLGCSERSIQRALTDDGFRFIRVRDAARLRAAESLLRSGHKLEDVCQRVGLATPSYFISWYKRLRGMTPSLVRAAGPELVP
jgi:AraC-like DNA-binding protein